MFKHQWNMYRVVLMIQVYIRMVSSIGSECMYASCCCERTGLVRQVSQRVSEPLFEFRRLIYICVFNLKSTSWFADQQESCSFPAPELLSFQSFVSSTVSQSLKRFEVNKNKQAKKKSSEQTGFWTLLL